MTYALPTGKGTPLEMARMKFYPLNSSGYIDAPSYPVPATTPFNGYEFLHPKTFTVNLGTPRLIPVPAQGQVWTTFVLPSLDAKTGEAHLAYMDLDTFAVLSNTKVHTIAGSRVGGLGTNKQGLELSGILLVQNLKFHDENGLDAWHSYIFPRVTCVFQPPAVNENVADVTVTISLSSSKKHITGAAFTEADHGFKSAVGLEVVSWGQLNLVAWNTDNSEHTFLLPDDAQALDTFVDTEVVYDQTDGSLVAGTPAADEFIADSAPAYSKVLLGWYEQVAQVG